MRLCNVLSLLLVAVSQAAVCQEGPTISTPDSIFSTDSNCSFFYSFDYSATAGADCDQKDSITWFITFDAWSNGAVDYAVSSAAPVNYTTWRVDENLSDQYGLPASCRWIYTAPTGADKVFQGRSGLITIPEELWSIESSHGIEIKVTDACGNIASKTIDVRASDMAPPTVYLVSLASFVGGNDFDGPGPIKASHELSAVDYNIGSFDNCTSQDQLIYYFDDIAPAFGSIVTVDSTTVVITKEIEHYYDDGGFVAFPQECIETTIDLQTAYKRYLNGEVYLWDPELRSSRHRITIDRSPYFWLHVNVADETGNESFSEVHIHAGVDQRGGLDDQSTTLDSSCSRPIIDLVLPTEKCPSIIDTFYGNIFIDIDGDRTVDHVVSTNAPETYEQWIEDTILSTIYSLPLATQWLYTRYTIQYDSIRDYRGNSITIPDINGHTGNFAISVTYDLVNQWGDPLLLTQYHNIRDISKPDIGCLSEVSLALDTIYNTSVSAATQEIIASDLLTYAEDNCSGTEDLMYLFDDAEPILGRGQNLPGAAPYPLDLSIPQYFNDTGFVDFVISSDNTHTPLDSNTIDRYHAGDIYRWDPDRRSAARIITSDMGPLLDLHITVRDAARNTSRCVITSELDAPSHTAPDPMSQDNTIVIAPNPFTEATTITWQQDRSGIVDISVVDVTGRHGLTISEPYVSGKHSWILDRNQLTRPGLYVVQLDIDGQRSAHKVILR